MNKSSSVSYPKAIVLLVLFSLLLAGILPGFIGLEAPAQKDVKNEQIDIKREIYFKSDASYPKLPVLIATNPNSHPENWKRNQFGVDENPRGIIGNAVVNYDFQTPKGWKVDNTNQRFSHDEDSVIFRLEGSSGIWGAIFKLELTDFSISDERDLARHYLDNRSKYWNLLKGVNGSIGTVENHLLQGFSSKRSEVINQYETYSTLELPQGDYASIAQYKTATNWGYVVDIHIPFEELNEQTRSTAYIIGKSFVAYRFL